MNVKVSQCENTKQAQSNMIYVNTDVPNHIVSINGYLFLVHKDNSIATNEVRLNSFQRYLLYVSFNDELKLIPYVINQSSCILTEAIFEVSCKSNRGSKLVFTNNELSEQWKYNYKDLPLNVGMKYHFRTDKANLIVEVKSIEAGVLGADGELTMVPNTKSAIFNSNASLTFVKKDKECLVIESDGNNTNNIFKSQWSFEEMGVGGLDKEFAVLFRRAFASRIYPQKIVKQLGITHVKGILLYGPPGTGKTLMAKQIGKMLDCVEPKIVNGPEIFDKMVGESEKRIRDLFKEAEEDEAENGPNARLHLIIMDEIDSICKKRGSVSGGTGVNDQVVNQLLTKIDGVNALNDVLLIGMTNRRDLIDEALLRPGRLEVQLEVHLPDQEGRKQIFQIHTKTPRENDRIDEDVNLDELAELTTNYTGAEIAGVVRSAISFSMDQYVNMNDLENSVLNTDDIKVNRSHFMKALDEVKPEFGIEDDIISKYMVCGCVMFSDEFRLMMDDMNYFIRGFLNSSGITNNNYLVYGRRGSGLTTCALTLVLNNEFNFVKLITADKFIGMSEDNVCKELLNVFTNAYRSTKAAIVVDDVDKIIEYSRMGPRYSNKILQAILTFMNTPTSVGNKLAVFITTTKKDEMISIGIDEDYFTKTIEMPLVCGNKSWMMIGKEMGVDMMLEDEVKYTMPMKKVIQVISMVRGEGIVISTEMINKCAEKFK